MASTSSFVSLGGLVKFEQRNPQFIFEGVEATLILEFFSENIVRVCATRTGQAEPGFSYAVTARPGAVDVEKEETDVAHWLRTKQMQVEVQKSPLRLRFLDAEGHLLNEDEPAFGIAWQGTEVTNYKTLQEKERFVGLGEKTGGLDRRGQYYTCWNTDYFGYGPEADPLYASIPFFMGLLPEAQKSYGIFFDNTHRTHFNFGASNDRFYFFQAEDGPLNYYFIHDKNPGLILESYTYLTGRTPLPPLWALGYQQCRYSYYPAQELLHLAQNFRERQIPADVLYLDIHYMEKYKVFTWDTTRFPDPAALMNQLREWGFKVVLIFDPGIKVEENYEPYEEGLAHDCFVTYPDGTPYRGQVWPGWCHFPDFTNPEVRAWWGTYFESLVQLGVLGFWNDMNEPAVWGKHFPDLVQFDWEGEGASHKQAHNVYGMQMARSTYEGVRKFLKNKRPFVLTRAAYAGIQRYSAVWTGDNVSEDQLMLSDVRIINSMGLSGLAFAGYDVGGFVGEANPALYSRWVALGAFSPFFRGHTMINSRDAEPWAFGEESEEIARNYIRLRYRLLPYLYSVFYETTQNGMPVQRSLVLNYPYEDSTYTPEAQNLYFFGPSILVAPVSSQQPIQKLFLPQGNWYNLFNDTPYEGPTYLYHETSLDTLPLFVKAGQMLWLQSLLNHTGEIPHPTLELHLYRGKTADTFVYYEDDGETYEYEAGLYYSRAVRYQPEQQRLVFDAVEGGTVSKFSQLRIYWHGWTLDTLAENLFLAETRLEVATEDYRFVEPISNFDPWEHNEDQSKTIFALPFVEIDWVNTSFEISVPH